MHCDWLVIFKQQSAPTHVFSHAVTVVDCEASKIYRQQTASLLLLCLYYYYFFLQKRESKTAVRAKSPATRKSHYTVHNTDTPKHKESFYKSNTPRTPHPNPTAPTQPSAPQI